MEALWSVDLGEKITWVAKSGMGEAHLQMCRTIVIVLLKICSSHIISLQFAGCLHGSMPSLRGTSFISIP
uniref:Uncharacterized protein n=1 Tax=Panagrellus redivivus TaxID=6233 RepID=A0A7E4ZT31_PANRE